MPLFEEHAEIVMRDGERVIACNHCHLSADRTMTHGEFPYALICPGFQRTIGEWGSGEEREAAIYEFIHRNR